MRCPMRQVYQRLSLRAARAPKEAAVHLSSFCSHAEPARDLDFAASIKWWVSIKFTSERVRGVRSKDEQSTSNCTSYIKCLSTCQHLSAFKCSDALFNFANWSQWVESCIRMQKGWYPDSVKRVSPIWMWQKVSFTLDGTRETSVCAKKKYEGVIRR